MTQLSGAEVEELRRLANEATPGPWVHAMPQRGVGRVEAPAEATEEWCGSIAWCDPMDRSAEQNFNNARFIAAANPITVLALLEALKESQRALDVERERGEELEAALTEGEADRREFSDSLRRTTAALDIERSRSERYREALRAVDADQSDATLTYRQRLDRIAGWVRAALVEAEEE